MNKILLSVLAAIAGTAILAKPAPPATQQVLAATKPAPAATRPVPAATQQAPTANQSTPDVKSYNIRMSASVPSSVSELLHQRLAKILSMEGLSLSDDGQALEVAAVVSEKTKTSGSMPQQVLVIDIKAGPGYTFHVKGVGKDEADAWQRAVRQIIPGSKEAKAFVASLEPQK